MPSTPRPTSATDLIEAVNADRTTARVSAGQSFRDAALGRFVRSGWEGGRA